MKPFQVFKVGAHTAMDGSRIDFGEPDVRRIAEAYDPAAHEAPIVVGHPAADAPAYGWVGALSYKEGVLEVDPRDVDPGFAALVQAGRFKKVSASFYGPAAASNPKPGGWYLRHVGFLGAQPPAVKGLKAIDFGGSDDGCVSVEFAAPSAWTLDQVLRGLRDWLLSEFGQEKADRALPGFLIDDMTAAAMAPAPAEPGFGEPAAPDASPTEKDQGMPQENLAARETAVAEAEARLAADREALAAQQRAFAEAQHRAQAAAFVDELVAGGRVLPRDRDGMVALVSRLDAEAETAAFGEGEPRTAGQYLRAFLASQPVQVDLAERAADDPERLPADAGARAVAQRANAYQEEQRGRGVVVDVVQAVDHVMQEARS